MDKICAIVDCQGFQFNNKFIPREIAIVSDYISQCQELDPKIAWHEFTEEEKNTVKYTTQFINGLYYRPFNTQEYSFLYNSKDIGLVLNIWYKMIASEEKPYFACKNKQMLQILIESEIPHINLDDSNLNFPSYKEIRSKYGDNYLCAYHKRPKRDIILTCALKKSAQIYREIKAFNK